MTEGPFRERRRLDGKHDDGVGSLKKRRRLPVRVRGRLQIA